MPTRYTQVFVFAVVVGDPSLHVYEFPPVQPIGDAEPISEKLLICCDAVRFRSKPFADASPQWAQSSAPSEVRFTLDGMFA